MSKELVIRALKEFIETRTPIAEYVSRRYTLDNESVRVIQIQKVAAEIAMAADVIQSIKEST
jgi:hypothetical protein